MVMIVGTGVDIAEVPRIRASIERFGDRFLRRIFTDGEMRYCERKASRFESYAARFAAKEAGMKALGTGWSRGVRWRDIEVVRPKGQRPTIQFHGEAAAIAAKLGTKNIALSLTHTSEQALAHVILENYLSAAGVWRASLGRADECVRPYDFGGAQPDHSK
jgi:holo-[acyl-carrier protein] synthase